MSGYYISAIYGEVDTVGEALEKEHIALDTMTAELHTALAKVNWDSASKAQHEAIMKRYNDHMADLHAQLNRLGGALRTAGVDLNACDRYVATHTFGI